MQAVNNNISSAFANYKMQLSFRPDHHRAGKAESTEHERKRYGLGDKPGIQLFRQEMLQTLRIRFQHAFRLTANPAESYRNSESPADVAAEILTAVRGVTENSADSPSDTLGQIRESVEKAANIGQEIVTSDEDSEALRETEREILRGLDAIENQIATSASAFSLQASVKQRSIIQIRTQEGDIVRFELRQAERLSVTDMAVENRSGSVSLTEIAISSRSRFVLTVDGNLNDAELTAIKNVFAQAEKLAEQFFAGDLNAAFEIAAALEFDSEQLARISIKFRSQQSISTSQTILQSTPIVAGIEDSAVNPVGSISTASPTPVIRGVSESRPAEEIVEDSPAATGVTAGLASLLDYLKLVADYLEDRAADPLPQLQTQSRVRFDITESLRLEILRTVMTGMTPAEAKGDSSGHGDIIKQLAENQEETL